MHPPAGDGRHIHHRTIGARQFIHQAPRQQNGGEKIYLKNTEPPIRWHCQRAKPRPALALWRNGGVIHQRMQHAAIRGQARTDFRDHRLGQCRVAQIKLNVILRPHFPGALFREGLARHGNHAPPSGRKALHRGMANPAGGACQQQHPARFIRLASFFHHGTETPANGPGSSLIGGHAPLGNQPKMKTARLPSGSRAAMGEA